MFSVNTKKEAEQLLLMCCPRNMNNEFVAVELADEQTLENLKIFSDKLASRYEILMTRRPVVSQ